MLLNLFGSFFNKIKNVGNQIDKIELNVIHERKKFKDIFERNLVLEKEIAERTEEVNQANKSLLTLKHIWSTMNSAEPLSEVLFTVTNGLTDGLNYLYCFVFQIYNTDEGYKLRVRAANQNDFSAKVENILKESIYQFEIPLNQAGNALTEAIKDKNIRIIKSFKDLYSGSIPSIKNEKLEQLDALLANRCISVLPIIPYDKAFGCLVAISIRNEVSDTEKNFLSLFAGQIELAVTIAGLFEQVREQAITDGLTSLFNRRHFDQCLASEVDRSIRLKQPFSLITLDLDYLKQINDTYGHSAGDAAIKQLGKILKQNARSVDIPARFGGEEFAVILPGIDINGALIAAERLRSAIENTPVEGVGTITASIGVATFLRHTDSLCELLELVDQAMYTAKRNGRNQVQLATAKDETDWQQLILDAFFSILSKQNAEKAPKIINELTGMLKESSFEGKSLPDFLYFVIDYLARVYDPAFKKDHTDRKLEIIEQLSVELNLPRSDSDKIKIAVILHDFGNMLIPENIYLKQSPLTQAEKEEALHHPILAAREILKPLKFAAHIISMIENHHEHWDGSGFPGNLSGSNIPIGSRILFIVDAYFAMISDRPYRKALSPVQATQILKEGANTKWDGELVKLFIDIIQKEKKTV